MAAAVAAAKSAALAVAKGVRVVCTSTGAVVLFGAAAGGVYLAYDGQKGPDEAKKDGFLLELDLYKALKDKSKVGG